MVLNFALALEMGCPLIYPRREAKAHGTRRAIEGSFEPGETTLLVDDLITRGDSKLEATVPLEAAGLEVRDILVLIDREQGGLEEVRMVLFSQPDLDAYRESAAEVYEEVVGS